jgi:hypothetical protein
VRLSTTLALLCFVALPGCGDKHVTVPDAAAPLDMHIAAPTLLAAATTRTNCLAVDGGFVYWADAAGGTPTIRKVSIDGGAASTVVTGGDKNGCVAVDGAGVYYTDGGQIMKAALAGGGATALASGQHLLPGAPLVAAGGYLYWITDVYGDVDAYNGKNAIVRLATAGGGSVEVVSAEVVSNPGGLAVDDSHIYYSDGSGVFARALAMPTTITSFGTSTLHPNALAVGGGALAMAEVAGVGMGDVAVFRLDGMGRVVVSSTLAQPLAVDDRGVYVNGAGRLVRLALDGSGPTELAEAQPRAVALFADHVYFTDGAAIYAVAK